MKQLIRNTTIQTAGKMVTVLISLIMTAWLTRRLGVNSYGIFTLTTSLFLLIDSLADFGTRVIGVREAACAKNDEEKAKIWINVAVLRKLLTSIAFVAGLGLVLFYQPFEGMRWWVFVALLMSWFTSIAGDQEIILQTEGRLDLKTIIDVLFPAGILVVLFVFGENLELGWVFGGYLISRIISLVVGWKLISSQISDIRFQIRQIDKSLIKRLLKESWPMGVYMLVFTSYDRAADALMIRHFWNEAQVAQYGLAYKIYGNLVVPAYFLAASVFPIMSKNEDKTATKKTLMVAVVMLLGLVPMIFLMAPWIINILAGVDFGESAVVLRILLGAVVFAYFNHILGFRLISKGGQKAMLELGIIALIVNIGLNLMLIPYFGMMAAAWVTVITEGVIVVMSLVKLKHDS